METLSVRNEIDHDAGDGMKRTHIDSPFAMIPSLTRLCPRSSRGDHKLNLAQRPILAHVMSKNRHDANYDG
jgi:hypothetical protein